MEIRRGYDLAPPRLACDFSVILVSPVSTISSRPPNGPPRRSIALEGDLISIASYPTEKSDRYADVGRASRETRARDESFFPLFISREYEVPQRKMFLHPVVYFCPRIFFLFNFLYLSIYLPLFLSFSIFFSFFFHRVRRAVSLSQPALLTSLRLHCVAHSG